MSANGKRTGLALEVPEVVKFKVIRMISDDKEGRAVIAVFCCKLPPAEGFDHDCIISYFTQLLDKQHGRDCVVVFFHQGLSDSNSPPLDWMWKTSNILAPKHKKQVKSVIVVHPSSTFRALAALLRPVVSIKFGQKLMLVKSLRELRTNLKCPHLYRFIPSTVLHYDKRCEEVAQQRQRHGLCQFFQRSVSERKALLCTRQFGSTIQALKVQNGGDPIPLVVRQCIRALEDAASLSTRGLGRDSADLGLIRDLKSRINRGEKIDLCEQENAHVAMNLLKHFLLDLREPLWPFDLYEEAAAFSELNELEKNRAARILIHFFLPEEGYYVLRHIMKFLHKVYGHSYVNMMTASELGTAFGPVIAWPSHCNGDLYRESQRIALFFAYLIENYEIVFIR